MPENTGAKKLSVRDDGSVPCQRVAFLVDATLIVKDFYTREEGLMTEIESWCDDEGISMNDIHWSVIHSISINV